MKWLIAFIMCFELFGMDHIVIEMPPRHAQARIEDLKSLILKSDDAGVKKLLRGYSTENNRAIPFSSSKNDLVALAQKVYTLRQQEEKSQSSGWRFPLRVLYIPCIVLKCTIDSFMVANQFQEDLSSAKQDFYIGMNLVLDAGLVISGGYNLYRLLGQENSSSKRFQAGEIIDLLRET